MAAIALNKYVRKFRSLSFRVLAKSPISDRKFYEIFYFAHHGRRMQWNNPDSFNSHIMWRKLCDRRAEHSIYADKLRSRQFVREKGLESILIELHATYSSVEEIEWQSLPDSFVIKTNHDSGSACIVKDKSDQALVALSKNRVQMSLANNYYRDRREWQYRDIRPCIMVERLLLDETGAVPVDYKFYCIGGQVEFVHVVSPDHRTGSVLDRNWTRLGFDYVTLPAPTAPKRPLVFDEMIRVAETLAEELDFVRVDLYVVGTSIYYGELTLTPNGGFGRFTPESYDFAYGQKVSQYKREHDGV